MLSHKFELSKIDIGSFVNEQVEFDDGKKKLFIFVYLVNKSSSSFTFSLDLTIKQVRIKHALMCL